MKVRVPISLTVTRNPDVTRACRTMNPHPHPLPQVMRERVTEGLHSKEMLLNRRNRQSPKEGVTGRLLVSLHFNRCSQRGKRKALRRTASDAEQRLWHRLRGKQLGNSPSIRPLRRRGPLPMN